MVQSVKSFKAASRLHGIKPSGIRRFFMLATSVPNVISLGVGEPDFTPPPHVLEAVKQALDHGCTHYAPTTGIPELTKALAGKARREYGLSYDPANEILVTVGGTQAIYTAIQSLINPGDEVLVPDPGFLCYQPAVNLAGGKPVLLPLREEDKFSLRTEDVISHITDKTRMLILNSPNNPTGAVFSRDSLMKIAKIVDERDLLVISDEVYEKITYDGAKHYCFASLPNMRDRTLVVGSFSKTYAMTGFRVGYVYGPQELIAPMMLTHQYSVACVDGLAQYGAIAALEGPQKFVKSMVAEFDRRRRFMSSRLNEIDGFSCALPRGTFYIFANIKGLKMRSEKVAEFLVKKAQVVTVHGSAFGQHGEGYLRFSYATAYNKLEEALDRIEKAIEHKK